MVNHRLLIGLLAGALSGGAVFASDASPRVITIEELFATAEANSVQMRPAFAAEEEARRGVAEARGGRLPDINASLSLSYIGDGFTTRRNFTDYQRAPIPHLGDGLSLEIAQPVYAGGAITSGIELAGQKLTAARFATDLRRDNLRFQLAGYYLDIYKYSNLREVVDSNLVRARRVLDEITARCRQGMALQNDVTRYELLVADLDLERVRINNTLEILSRNLAVTAGLPADTQIVPDPSILGRSLGALDEEAWRRQAADNSPVLRVAQSSVDISRTAETLAESERRPKIMLCAGWNIDGPILTEIPPVNRNLSYWFVGIGMTYSLSSLYKADKSVATRRAATQTALARLDAACETTELEVRAAYTRYLEAYEELQTCTKSLELAESNYHTVATRYAAGMALITDMLDAANSRLAAGRRLVNARIDIIYYYYKLLFTSGTI